MHNGKETAENLLMQRISQRNSLKCAAVKILYLRESKNNWDLRPDIYNPSIKTSRMNGEKERVVITS